MKDPRDSFEMADIFSVFEQDPTVIFKRMFGGLAVYYNGRLVGALFEDANDFTWKKKKFPFPVWYGLLVPTDFKHHESLKKEFKELINHPVLGKWLYLPATDEADFRAATRKITGRIFQGDARFGVLPKPRKSRKK